MHFVWYYSVLGKFMMSKLWILNWDLRSAEQHPESTGSERPGPEVLKWCCSVNARTYSKTLKYIMVPVNNSKPSFSSPVFICSTILVHAWPLFLNLRDLQRSRNWVWKLWTWSLKSTVFRPISGIYRLSTGFSYLFLVLGLGSIAKFHAVLRA